MYVCTDVELLTTIFAVLVLPSIIIGTRFSAQQNFAYPNPKGVQNIKCETKPSNTTVSRFILICRVKIAHVRISCTCRLTPELLYISTDVRERMS